MKKIIFALIMAGLFITGCGEEEGKVNETANSIVEVELVEEDSARAKRVEEFLAEMEEGSNEYVYISGESLAKGLD